MLKRVIVTGVTTFQLRIQLEPLQRPEQFRRPYTRSSTKFACPQLLSKARSRIAD